MKKKWKFHVWKYETVLTDDVSASGPDCFWMILYVWFL